MVVILENIWVVDMWYVVYTLYMIKTNTIQVSAGIIFILFVFFM